MNPSKTLKEIAQGITFEHQQWLHNNNLDDSSYLSYARLEEVIAKALENYGHEQYNNGISDRGPTESTFAKRKSDWGHIGDCEPDCDCVNALKGKFTRG